MSISRVAEFIFKVVFEPNPLRVTVRSRRCATSFWDVIKVMLSYKFAFSGFWVAELISVVVFEPIPLREVPQGARSFLNVEKYHAVLF